MLINKLASIGRVVRKFSGSDALYKAYLDKVVKGKEAETVFQDNSIVFEYAFNLALSRTLDDLKRKFSTIRPKSLSNRTVSSSDLAKYGESDLMTGFCAVIQYGRTEHVIGLGADTKSMEASIKKHLKDNEDEITASEKEWAEDEEYEPRADGLPTYKVSEFTSQSSKEFWEDTAKALGLSINVNKFNLEAHAYEQDTQNRYLVLETAIRTHKDKRSKAGKEALEKLKEEDVKALELWDATKKVRKTLATGLMDDIAWMKSNKLFLGKYDPKGLLVD